MGIYTQRRRVIKETETFSEQQEHGDCVYTKRLNKHNRDDSHRSDTQQQREKCMCDRAIEHVHSRWKIFQRAFKKNHVVAKNVNGR